MATELAMAEEEFLQNFNFRNITQTFLERKDKAITVQPILNCSMNQRVFMLEHITNDFGC